MKTTALFAVLAAVISMASARSNFFVVKKKETQKDGQKACKDRGATIASFHDNSEYKEAAAICKDACASFDNGWDRCGCWTGLKDDKKENKWYNADGSKPSLFSNADGTAKRGKFPWHANEPNEGNNGEDCTVIWKKQGYDLNDTGCKGKFLTMCRIEAPAEFFAIDAKTSHDKAGEKCKKQNGELASMHQEWEFEKASQLCKKTCDDKAGNKGDCGCWVGLKDDKKENKWYNVDGTKQDYMLKSNGAPKAGKPWGNGQPNDSGSGQDCVRISKSHEWYLDDNACNNGNNFAICRKKAPQGNNRYFAIKSTLSQAKASAKCKDKKGTMAAFQSDKDFEYASELCKATCKAKSPGVDDCGCWTGVREKTKGVWYNENGSPQNYLMRADGSAKKGEYPWGDNEPNNAGNQDCTRIWKKQKWKLNDVSCKDANNYAICHKDPGQKMDDSDPMFDLFNDFDKEVRYEIYWLMAFAAISAALFVSCLALAYVNCLTQNRGGQKYSKVVMMSSDTEAEVDEMIG